MPGPMGGPGHGPGPMGRPGRGMPGEKMDAKALSRIFVYSRRWLPAVVTAVLCAVVSSVLTTVGPDWISDLMNTIVAGILTGIDMDEVARIALTLVGIYAVGAVLGYAQQFIMATVTQHTARGLRSDIDSKLNRLPLHYYDTTTRGDILSRVTNDVDTISQTLASSIANLISAVTLFVCVLYQMFTASPILSLVTIASSLLGFAGMMLILPRSQKYFDRKQELLGTMNGQIEEVYTNHKIVTAFGAQDRERGKFDAVNTALYESNWKSQFLSGIMMPLMSFSGNLAYAMIFIVGVAMIVNGSDSMTLGTISAFIIYAKLFSQPLTTFSQAMTSLQQASAASRRVFGILDEAEMPDESEKTAALPAVRGQVEFDHVSFGYLPGKPIIHDFSASLKPGQKVAIVGPTGAGKTTMVNLLMRFYDIDSGDIRIDGVSTSLLKRESVHELFDMILQDTWLFHGTIRENLVYNKENISDERIEEALKAVSLSRFVRELPQGLDTVLDDSLNLSEGQKQQLTIARAILKDAPLLILDEATSSVDTRTELQIQAAMDRLTESRTSFVIAHRLSTIRDADIILVMRGGDIVEQGRHAELLARGGFYADLYNSQFAV